MTAAAQFREAIASAGFIVPGKNVFERFAAKVEQVGSCWIWTASKFKNGYGKFAIGSTRAEREIEYAHRAAYRMFVGPIPRGMVVCHGCDVRDCVNPAHLFLGTQKENIRDCISKGRARYHTGPNPNGSGERHGNHKLTEDAVREIRSSQESNVALGAKFGVSYKAIWSIRSGKGWAHVVGGAA